MIDPLEWSGLWQEAEDRAEQAQAHTRTLSENLLVVCFSMLLTLSLTFVQTCESSVTSVARTRSLQCNSLRMEDNASRWI